MNSQNAENAWKFFPDIRCIHLKNRKDREDLVTDVKQKLHIPLRYFYAEPHPNGGVTGCYESHVAVMREALNERKSMVLIFEDDLEIGQFMWTHLHEVINFVSNRKDWDIFYLGCFPDIWGNAHQHITGNIYKVKATQTHAYIVSNQFMERIAYRPFDGTPIDEVFLEGSRSYAILPSLFVQASSSSDVSNVSFISVFPAKRIITNAIEMYAINFGIPVRTLLISVLFACVAVKIIIRSVQNVKNGRFGNKVG